MSEHNTSIYLEGFKPRSFAKTSDKTTDMLQKGTGPKAADGFDEKAAIDPACPECAKNNYYTPTKFSQPVEKKDKKKINNLKSKKNMNEFDKLYEQVTAGEDVSLDTENNFDTSVAPDNDTETAPEAEHEAEEMDFVSELQEISARLQEIATKMSGSEAVENEDEGGMGSGGDELSELEVDDNEEVTKEGVEAEEIGHPLVNQRTGNPDKISAKGNEVKGSVLKTNKGKAVTAAGGKKATGEIEEFKGGEDMTKVNKSMEVKGSVLKTNKPLIQ